MCRFLKKLKWKHARSCHLIKTFLKPGSGNLIASVDKLDIVLGCYWMTSIVEGERDKVIVSVLRRTLLRLSTLTKHPSELKFTSLSKRKKFESVSETMMETSVGRILFNELLPENIFPQ